MSFRRVIQGSAITVLVFLCVPQAAWASTDDGHHDSTGTTSPESTSPESDCAATGRGSHGDDGHDAGERDNAHEHEGHDLGGASDDAKPSEDADDCAVLPPAEVPEAPNALTLSASAAVTGGAAVLVLRRRSRAVRSSAGRLAS